MFKLSLRKPFHVAIIFLFNFLLIQNDAFALPSITNIEIRNIGYTSVTIVWKTDIASNSQISYGDKSVDAYKSPTSTAYDTDHSVTLTNLRPATKYSFKITSVTQNNEVVTSDVQQFSTLSFTFEDDAGTFGNINATPSPTPYINPYAQYIPQTNAPHYNTNQQQPLYIVPPIVYQQPQMYGQTLGESNSQQVANTSDSEEDSALISLIQSGIWGIVLLFGILIVIVILLFTQLMKNKSELHELQQHILHTRITDTTVKRYEEPEKKVYRFDVRS